MTNNRHYFNDGGGDAGDAYSFGGKTFYKHHHGRCLVFYTGGAYPMPAHGNEPNRRLGARYVSPETQKHPAFSRQTSERSHI